MLRGCSKQTRHVYNPSMPHSVSWQETRIPFTHDSPVWIRPGPTATSPLVVLCHGMGEDPRSFTAHWPRVAALPFHLVAPAGPYPHEIRRDDSIRIGYAWYLYDKGPEHFEQTTTTSVAWLCDVVSQVESKHGFRPDRRILVGHSQGAYFGYLAALGTAKIFSHLVAVAGRLKEEFLTDALGNGGSTAVLILHGTKDRAVSPDAARRSHDALSRAGYPVELELLPGGHGLTPETDARTATWLKKQLRL